MAAAQMTSPLRRGVLPAIDRVFGVAFFKSYLSRNISRMVLMSIFSKYGTGFFLIFVLLGLGVRPAAAQEPGSFLGALVSSGSGGLDAPVDLVFGLDGRLYVTSFGADAVLRYSGNTGAFLGAFVSSGSGGLDSPEFLVFGPDGNLYVSSAGSDEVLRYSGNTGAFLGAFVSSGSGGLDAPFGLTFGPDNNLYVSSFNTDAVLRYSGSTGAFLGTFVAAGSGELDAPRGLTFGPDNNLYVSSANTGGVLRYSGSTGAFLDEFVPRGEGGLSGPVGLVFGPDGNLYVSSSGTDAVLRYNGSIGVFIDAFAAEGSGGLDAPFGLTFGPDDNLYVGSSLTNAVLRYVGPGANSLPSVVASIADRQLDLGGAVFTTDLNAVFDDFDGDVLTFSAQSNNTTVARADVSGSTLTVAPQLVGKAIITVIADDGNGGQAQTTFTVIVYPTAIFFNINQRFGDAARQVSYRLVGLPGDLNLALASTLSGTPGEDWRAFRDTGSEGADSLAEFDGSSAFNFRLGRGFWLLSRQPWVAVDDPDTAPISADGAVSITLHDGWNIISNPFELDLPWSDVLAFNGLSVTKMLFRWNGRFSQVSTFTSATGGEAFYFFNDAGLSQLRIPYPGIASIPEAAPLPSPSRVLTVSAYVEGRMASSVRVGMAEAALVGHDDYDQAAPPGYFEAASLRLPGDGSSPRSLAAEYRPEGAEGYVFDVTLQAPEASPVTLAVEGLDAFAGRAVFLVDGSKAYDLREHTVLPVAASPEPRRYRLVIGTRAFVEGATGEAVPGTITLLPNYPNPFNPSTVIEYGLPASAAGEAVRLAVYDVAGRRVRLLVDARQAAGFYRVTWDGADEAGAPVASGVYVYRLRAGGFQQVRKMILLK